MKFRKFKSSSHVSVAGRDGVEVEYPWLCEYPPMIGQYLTFAVTPPYTNEYGTYVTKEYCKVVDVCVTMETGDVEVWITSS